MYSSVSVQVVLVWTDNWNVNVVSLLLGKNGKLSTKCWKMEGSDLLIKFFWKEIDLTSLIFIGLSVIPKLNLGKSLVGE